MAFVNLASATKLDRANQIVTDIGANGVMNLYAGAVPVSPDLPNSSDTLLVSMPLSPVAGVASLGVQQAVITAAGTQGTDGSYALAITGDGTGAAGIFVVSGGSITSVMISAPGSGYTTLPTLNGFGNAGLSGAALTPVMTGVVSFNPIYPATATGSGVPGYARICTATGTPIIDLDVGMTNAYSVVLEDAETIVVGASVAVFTSVLIEQ